MANSAFPPITNSNAITVKSEEDSFPLIVSAGEVKERKRVIYENLEGILKQQVCVAVYYKRVLRELQQKLYEKEDTIDKCKKEVKQLLRGVITLEVRNKMLLRNLHLKRGLQTANGPINKSKLLRAETSKNAIKISPMVARRTRILNRVALLQKSKQKSKDAGSSYHFPTSIPLVDLNADSEKIIDLTHEDDDPAIVDQASDVLVTVPNGQILPANFDITSMLTQSSAMASLSAASPTD